jgi:hypothetical protein
MMVTSARDRKSWTVLAYIVADHPDIPGDQVAGQIDSIAHDEVDSILWAADLSRVNVAVQVDFSHLAGVLRVIATGRGFERTVLPEEDAGRIETFTSFIEQVAQHCPAHHYMLLLWGHGQGPIGFFADAHADGVMNEADRTLSLLELEHVLEFAAGPRAFGQPLDLLVGKSCSLATIEASYQFKDHVNLMVSSQATVPLKAWTYGDIFRALGTDVDATGRKLLTALGKQYRAASNRLGRAEVPYSLIRPSRIDALGTALRGLATSLAAQPDALGQPPYVDAIAGARRPSSDVALLDLGALCSRLMTTTDTSVAPHAEHVVEVLRSAATPVLGHQPADSTFHGISAFFLPPAGARRHSFGSAVTTFDYRKLRVCEATAWDHIAFAADGAAASL